MITASLTDSYNLTSKQPQPGLLMDNKSVYTTTAAIVDNSIVPDLLAENSQHNSNNSGSSSAEEAVFLPTYATLPTTNLEEEPNPFEQSFEGAAATITKLNNNNKPILPSVKSIDNPKPTRLDALENQWDSLRSGILSPSMLPGPATTSNTAVVRRPIKYELETTTFYNHTYENPPPTVNRKHTRKISNSTSSSEGSFIVNKKQKTNAATTKVPEDEEKRKNFLERNRIAALKCRQRKKQWLQNLQTKIEYLAADNEQFQMQATALREELINLKTLLMAHKDCPINQQDLKVALNRPIPAVPSLPHSLSNNNNNQDENVQLSS